MQRVTIVGLGLIGGSIGLGLRRWSADQGKDGALQVTGFDSDLAQQQYAQKINAVDRAEWRLDKAVRDADLVVVCTPVATMRDLFADIAPHLQAGAVVTDVGSTKADVLRWADSTLPTTVSFVGGHPMAGKAQSIEAAEADLFKGATWCVCPSVRAGEDAIRTVLGLIAAVGAESYFVDPTEHDAYVAGVSHLPAVVSAALMRSVSRDPSWRDMKTLSATGFRDVTRLAAGSPAMHRDILLTNRDAVGRWIDQLVTQLQEVRADLAADDRADRLDRFFTEARDARADWATQTGREGELLQATQDELGKTGIGDQMGRMLLGGLMGRRRTLPERGGRGARSNGREERHG
ncbi:MAG: Prephenate and/or arogenate dehydrogenase (unknown specificity)(EC [uncultured Thermomicrobiales bacterium]|uniref:Prephenate/arogenate dehydrogenase domain-containing protein n=1 Tax=uncultured Thermomicrobiales bacterium TaxID=1645740 RepID=A0A6J4U8U9_9BACT|nr:MAG: Prephenate and/or arogenate dehydrogenase (unknown specificity)(EC [uncultured Thermomicrobiales bacterium]